MRRAEWRRRADDPTSLFGWWWRSVGENRRLILAVLPFGVCALVGFAGGGWGWLVLAAANLAFVAGRTRRSSDRLTPLLPDPAPRGQFRACVAYERDGVPTGGDEMALVVVEGWLYAEGVRSHFAVRREHLRDLRTGSDGQGRLVLTDGTEIRLREIDDAARIALERWWQAKALGDGEPTFPPARVHPQELARRAGWLMASALLFFLVLAGRFALQNAESGVGFVLVGGASSLLLSGRSFQTFLALVRVDARAEKAFGGSTSDSLAKGERIGVPSEQSDAGTSVGRRL